MTSVLGYDYASAGEYTHLVGPVPYPDLQDDSGEIDLGNGDDVALLGISVPGAADSGSGSDLGLLTLILAETGSGTDTATITTRITAAADSGTST